jgi:hypothetical protein
MRYRCARTLVFAGLPGSLTRLLESSLGNSRVSLSLATKSSTRATYFSTEVCECMYACVSMRRGYQ